MREVPFAKPQLEALARIVVESCRNDGRLDDERDLVHANLVVAGIGAGVVLAFAHPEWIQSLFTMPLDNSEWADQLRTMTERWAAEPEQIQHRGRP